VANTGGLGHGGHPGFSFHAAYDARPPWDIGRPQPVFVAAADEGLVAGTVFDAGCGTGENALLFAQGGHDVLGVDIVEKAIEEARRKAEERGLSQRASFEVGDAAEIPVGGRRFETVTDSGFFHALDDERRARFVERLADALVPGGRYLMLCFSDRVPGAFGPRRISEAEIRDAFAGAAWEVREVREAVLESTVERMPHVPAWFAVVERL
jgi:cyclopropane fatty-acyl-phospholipid synthase-like methyltransferase